MKLAVSNPEEAVRLSVKLRQMLGLKQAHAFDDAGDALSLTQRYVRGIIRGELRNRHWRLIQHLWWADLDRQAAQFRAVADAIDRQKEADQIAELQLTLPLGDGSNDLSNPRVVRSNSMEARSEP
jgi:hypothetical protein